MSNLTNTPETSYYNLYIQHIISKLSNPNQNVLEFYEFMNFCVKEDKGNTLIIYFDKIINKKEILLYKVIATDNVYVTDNNPLGIETEGGSSAIEYPVPLIDQTLHDKWIIANEKKNRLDSEIVEFNDKLFTDWFENVATTSKGNLGL